MQQPTAKQIMKQLEQSGVDLRVTRHDSGLYTAKCWNSDGGIEPVEKLAQDLRLALAEHNLRFVTKSEQIADWREDQPRIGALIQFRINAKAVTAEAMTA